MTRSLVRWPVARCNSEIASPIAAAERPVKRGSSGQQRLGFITCRWPLIWSFGCRCRRVEKGLRRHHVPHPGLIASDRRWRPATRRLASAPEPATAAWPDGRSGAWHAGPSARDRGTAGTAGRGRRRAARAAARAHRRSTGAGSRGNGASASWPSGTRADSSEQMPFSNTSQAISVASGCARTCARACSPPPKPTSSHSGLSADSARPASDQPRSCTAAQPRQRHDPAGACWRGRSLWPRARP